MSELGLEGAGLNLREEPDGILRLSVQGEFTEGVARAIVAAIRRVAESGRDVLMLCNLSRAAALSAPVRKVIADEMRTARIDAVAIVGAAFSLRVVVTLATKGVQLLTAQAYPLEFFDAESDARAWLLARGAALRGKRSPVV
ncbi:STAS/SEC14 domain-containing protein [Sorangium sp. So ce260]|uniref:STAS/SEC14 domain-containing protein n=1 Tax=Sorangium sp. So ce260 TaxID=3133291 RepID=UPI003F63E4E0